MTLPTYTPDALRGVMAAHKLTGSRVARLTSVDSRTVRRWTAHPDVPTHKRMPDSTWYLLLILLGEITPQQLYNALMDES